MVKVESLVTMMIAVIVCKNDAAVDNGFTLMHKTLTLDNESNVAMYRNCIK